MTVQLVVKPMVSGNSSMSLLYQYVGTVPCVMQDMQSRHKLPNAMLTVVGADWLKFCEDRKQVRCD